MLGTNEKLEESQDLKTLVSSGRVQFPADYRNTYERISEDNNGSRREVFKNNRELTAEESFGLALDNLFSTPTTASELTKQAVVSYVGGATTIRTTDFLADYGHTGYIIASMPWLAVVFLVAAGLSKPSRLFGLSWRAILFVLGGL